jgi:hypothetical protein
MWMMRRWTGAWPDGDMRLRTLAQALPFENETRSDAAVREKEPRDSKSDKSGSAFTGHDARQAFRVPSRHRAFERHYGRTREGLPKGAAALNGGHGLDQWRLIELSDDAANGPMSRRRPPRITQVFRRRGDLRPPVSVPWRDGTRPSCLLQCAAPRLSRGCARCALRACEPQVCQVH